MIVAARYVAIKIDIRHSRASKDRALLQTRLFSVADALNSDYEHAIQARFVVTHGDEIQGMLKNAGAPCTFRIMERAIDGVYPWEPRFGIGFGELMTPVQATAIGMDGPAWYRASEGLDMSKTRRKYAAFRGLGDGQDFQVDALANLLLHQRARWTEAQRRAIELVEYGMTQAAVAHEFGVSEAAVSNRLAAAGWQFYKDGREAVEQCLQDYALSIP